MTSVIKGENSNMCQTLHEVSHRTAHTAAFALHPEILLLISGRPFQLSQRLRDNAFPGASTPVRV
jgi:hypothetical protein